MIRILKCAIFMSACSLVWRGFNNIATYCNLLFDSYAFPSFPDSSGTSIFLFVLWQVLRYDACRLWTRYQTRCLEQGRGWLSIRPRSSSVMTLQCNTLVVLWLCFGCALVVLWLCFGCALVVLWLYWCYLILRSKSLKSKCLIMTYRLFK